MSKQKILQEVQDKQTMDKMKQITHLIFTFFIMISYSCQKKETEHKINEPTNNAPVMDDNILKKQIEYGSSRFFQEAGVEMPKPEFSDDELNEVAAIASDILKKNGFTEISDENFKNKVKDIFDRTLEMNSDTKILYLNFLDICNREIIQYPNNGTEYLGTYIFKKQKMITDFYYLPEIIDYKQTNPGIYDYEASLPETFKDNDGDPIKIQKWRDVEKLPEIRSNNILKIINRNKFLFNDNKGSFAWLRIHDLSFLNALVKTFGYTKDKDLLTFVLKKNYKNLDELQKILWAKKCNGDIVVNKEIFTIISEASEQDRSAYLKAISEYLVKEAGRNDGALTNESEKIKILGLIAYYSTKAGEKSGQYYDFFSIFGSKDGGARYAEEFKKNNYYQIADFKKVWEETKNSGISYPGME
ncbi:hypothetical protein [Chryseobacterium hagamense]|nr:hypothetical protein [Chryseobacterium hagamense]